jgi:type I restriction enzyme, S subunit
MIPEAPFAELLSDIVDNRGRSCPTEDQGFMPLIATNCVSNNRLYPRYDTSRYVSRQTYDTWFRGHPQPGDLLFVCKGSPGRVCMVPAPVDFCIAQDMVAVRPDPARVYPRYLFAALRSPLVQARIAGMHVGTLIPHFKKGDFDKLLIPLPAEAVQVAIGDFYFNLSAKVEQNERTAAALIGLADSLFQAWFVDFEPVEAKGAGHRRFASMPSDLYGAFPDRLVDSPAGPIPRGWEVKPLSSIATFLNGLALQKYPPRGDGTDVPVIKIAQLRRGSVDGSSWASADVPEQYMVADGDVLFSWSGTLAVDAWFGGAGALNQHLFKVSSADWPRWFYLHWLCHHLPWFQAVAKSKATTMGHINRKHLDEALVPLPPPGVLRGADPVIGGLHRLRAALGLESRSVSAFRDLLLPKLLVGDVAIDARAIGGSLQ